MFDEQLLVAPMAVAVKHSLKHAVALGFGEQFMPSFKAQCKINGIELKG